MDQLKRKFAVAIRHGFWIATVIVTFGSLAVWFLATGRLADENAERTTALESDVQSVSQVRSAVPTHPNDQSHQRMEVLIDRRQDQVLDAWTSVFERQQTILEWPNLGRGFVEEFKDLIPIERFVDHPPTPEQQKNTELLTRYATYIGTTLPEIAEIAKTKWEAEFASQRGSFYGGGLGMEMDMNVGTGMGPRRRPRDEERPLVKWSRESQQKVQGDLFPWLGDRPSTLEVYYSQENIWILKQLLQIIANVNGDATQPFQARIHEIQRIGIGSSVKFDSGRLARPGANRRGAGAGVYLGGMEGMEGDEGYEDVLGLGGPGGMMEGPGGMMEGEGVGDRVDVDPAENRYVDMQNQPIPAATLRSALDSNRPEDATIAVAKRVPVMMSLRMDQRYIHQLLAECGSVPLMVEVRRVRVLPKSDTRGRGGMGGGPGGEYTDAGGGGGDTDGDGLGLGLGLGLGGFQTGSQRKNVEFPLDVDVEVYGLIYIYNPPDPEKLGLEQVTEDTVIDGSATPSQPQPTVDAPTEDSAPADDAPPASDDTSVDDSAPVDDDDESTDPAAEADAAGAAGDVADPETLPEPGSATSEDADNGTSVERVPGSDQPPADDSSTAPDGADSVVTPEPAP